MSELARIGKLLACLNRLQYGLDSGAYGIANSTSSNVNSSRGAVEETTVQLIALMDDMLMPHALCIQPNTIGVFCIVPFIGQHGEK